MAYEVKWHVPNRVVLARFWGRPLPEENLRVSPDIIRLFEESPYPLVHVMLDDGKMEGLPASLPQMREVASFLAHPKMGWVVGVAPVNSAVKFMGVFLNHVFKMRYKRFESLAEGERFLTELEPDLTALMPIQPVD